MLSSAVCGVMMPLLKLLAMSLQEPLLVPAGPLTMLLGSR